MCLERARPLRQVLAHPLQQVHRVGIVVAGHVLAREALARVAPGGLEQQVERLARGLEMRILGAVDVAATGVVEVREVELFGAFVVHQRQQRGQLVGVESGHRVAQSDLDAAPVQQAHPFQAAVEGPVPAAKAVVHRADAVQTDAHVVEPGLLDAVGHRGVDQRAVARQPDIEAHRPGARGDLEQVGTQQRLAAGEDQHRHAEGLQVGHHLEDLGGAEFACVVVVGRQRVAVLAGQVAAADQVPDDDRAARLQPAWWRHRPVAFGRGQQPHILRNTKHGHSSLMRRPVFFRMAVEYNTSPPRQAAPSTARTASRWRSTSAREWPCSIANRLKGQSGRWRGRR